MQTCATHPKTARREEKSDQKKAERIGAQLAAEIMGPPTDTATFAISDPTWAWRPSSSHSQPTWASQPERKCGSGGACATAERNEQRMAWSAPHESSNHNITQRSVLEPTASAGRSMRGERVYTSAADFSSAGPTGTADLHAIGRLLDPCVCALLRHVGSVLIVIGSAGLGGDDERGEMGEVGGVGSRQ